MQYASWTSNIAHVTYEIEMAQTHMPFWHALCAHRHAGWNFDVVGVRVWNAAWSRALIYMNREDAACGWLGCKKSLPIRFSACHPLQQLLYLHFWRRKWARHILPPSLTPSIGIVQAHMWFEQTGRAILGPNSRQNFFFRQISVCAYLYLLAKFDVNKHGGEFFFCWEL